MSRRTTLMVPAIVLALLTSSMAVQLHTGSERADAAAPAGIGSISVEIFTERTEDYSALVYLSEKLPLGLSPAEWARDPGNGLWYNVNENSFEYGRVLTYGSIGNVPASIVRSDVPEHFSGIFSSGFFVMQIKYSVASPCGVTAKVEKAGAAPFTVSKQEAQGAAGFRFVREHQSAILCTVESSNGDIRPSDVRGTYSVSVLCDGVEAVFRTVDHLGSDLRAGGSVVDAGGNPIAGAEVAYTDGGLSKTVATGADGRFLICAVRGSVVTVTGITATGFTFSDANIPYTFGTMISDALPGPAFAASEKSVTVTVKDRSDNPVPGVNVEGVWYYQRGSGPDYAVTSENPQSGTPGTVAFTSSLTDGSGKVRLTFKDPVKDPAAEEISKLMVRASPGATGYIFETDSIETGNSVGALGALTGDGNEYVDTVTCTDVELAAEQSSVVITVTGYGPGAALADVVVDATWYYQTYDNENVRYVISDAAPASPAARGTAWAGKTGADGKATLYYTAPSGLNANQKAYILVAARAPAPSSGPVSEFTFDTAVPVTGAKGIDEQVAGHSGCAAIPSTSVSGTSLSSREAAYTVTGKITGTVPGSISVIYRVGALQATIGAVSEGGEIGFKFPVMGGRSASIEFGETSGYRFTNMPHVLPSASSDMAYSSEATAIPDVFAREAPVLLARTFSVEGLESGDLITFSFSEAGLECAVTLAAASDAVSFRPSGREGYVVTGMSATGISSSGGSLYMRNAGADAWTAHHFVERRFVTYSSQSGTPDIQHAYGNAAIDIFIGGSLYRNVRTNASGIAAVVVPDVPGITYRYGDYSVTPSEVPSGAFSGYTAFNLAEMVDADAAVDVTIRVKYTATSSRGETTAVEILNPDPSSPISSTFKSETVQTLTAPDLEGFAFSGWYLGGVNKSDPSNIRSCTLRISEDMDGQTLIAAYSTVEPPAAPAEFDGTSVAVGFVAVTIAILAFAYVLIQAKRY